MKSLAIVASHPVQYQAPWYRALATMTDLRVFFAHRVGAEEQGQAGFGVAFDWNVPLLDGYQFEWLDNVASRPGVDRFFGCDTPGIVKRISRGGFDAVVVNGWNLRSYWQAIVAARRAGVPVMVRGDSQLVTERSGPRRLVKRLTYPRLLRSFDAFLTVGRRSEAYYRHYGVADGRMFRSPHCVDNDFFAAAARIARAGDGAIRRAAGIGDHEIVFALVGKLIAKKRPLDYLAALAEVRRTHPAVRGLIVGDGPMRSEIEAFQRRHDTGSVLIGFLNQQEIAAAYVAADALVLPSDGGETWGLVVNEAMACGTPAIVSDAVGCGPDLIDEGRTGFSYAYGDVAGLAGCMARFATQPLDGRAALSRAALDRIAHYSPHAAAVGVVDAMTVLNSGRADRRSPNSNHVDAVS
jgi:glycosyltransferase involved in cell wall biosynthesis